MAKVLDNYVYANFWYSSLDISYNSYLPTPLPGQDMTQGQFLSGV